MKKFIVCSLIMILLNLGSIAILGSSSNKSTEKPRNKPYTVEVLVPNQIISITSEMEGFSIFSMSAGYYHVTAMKQGIKEVSEKYIIKSATPIEEPMGTGEASYTACLILFVESKK